MRFNSHARRQRGLRKRGIISGLIFVDHSKRCVSLRQAQELVTASPLHFVGVFQNQEIDFIVKIAKQLQLYAFSYTVQKPLNLLLHFAINYLRILKFGKLFQSILKHKVQLILLMI